MSHDSNLKIGDRVRVEFEGELVAEHDGLDRVGVRDDSGRRVLAPAHHCTVIPKLLQVGDKAETAEQLEALPAWSVVVDWLRGSWQKRGDRWVSVSPSPDEVRNSASAYLIGVTVVWIPVQ